MNESLELPIDRTVDLTNASYKNPGRLLVRSNRNREGWTVYFGINGKSWEIGELVTGSAGTALVFSGPWDKNRIPWDGNGKEPEGGPNQTLAAASGGLVTYAEIRAADKYAIWAVSPDRMSRSLAWVTENDIYDTRRDSGYRTPKKTRRSNPSGPGVPIPPGFDIEEEPEEPPSPMPKSLLPEVTAERIKYGTPLTLAEMGEILNVVAWNNRGDGWGLAGKTTGARTKQPHTGVEISRDLLVHLPSQRMFDVFADVGGEARPSWNDVGALDMPFVPPVDPAGEGDDEEPSDDYARGFAAGLEAAILAIENLD